MSENLQPTESAKTSQVSTADLHRTLGRGDLMSIAVGQIIGAGIMSLMGSAIGLTGTGVPLAFLVAAVFTCIQAIPQVLINSTIRIRGGTYTILSMFAGKKIAGMYVIIYIVQNVSIAMYAISFEQYFLSVIPGPAPVIVGIVFMTVFYVLNLFGIQGAAKLQSLMAILMGVALAIFAAFGMFKVDFSVFNGAQMFSNGTMSFLRAGTLLTFATGGATVICNLGAEAKNPKKDFPFVIIVSTLSVAALYGIMAMVASGVLPISQVAGQPLTLVAKAVLPGPLYVFFIVAGAWFALATTLNATLSWVTKPLMQAAVDGWIPPVLAKLHPKYNTPYVLLTIFYIVGIIPIILNVNISQVASFALVLGACVNVIICVSMARLPKVVPEQWGKSPFHVSNGVLSTLAAMAAFFMLLQAYLQLGNLASTTAQIGTGVVVVLSVGFGLMRANKTHQEKSYEDD